MVLLNTAVWLPNRAGQQIARESIGYGLIQVSSPLEILIRTFEMLLMVSQVTDNPPWLEICWNQALW